MSEQKPDHCTEPECWVVKTNGAHLLAFLKGFLNELEVKGAVKVVQVFMTLADAYASKLPDPVTEEAAIKAHIEMADDLLDFLHAVQHDEVFTKMAWTIEQENKDIFRQSGSEDG